MRNLVMMKIVVFCSMCTFILTVDATVYNTSLLKSRIMGGYEVAAPEYIKYMAAILEHKEVNGRFDFHHICGAFAITKKHVVTADVCYMRIWERNFTCSYEAFRVIVGVFKHDPNLLRRIGAAKDFKTVPFKPFDQIYSIGILRLLNEIPEEITMDDVLSNENVSPGDKCYTLGWGLEDYFEGSESENMSTYLKLLEIVIHDDEDCSREFYTDMYLQNHIFCGRTTLGCGKTMPGDYGGPLICRKRLVGIAIPPQSETFFERRLSFFLSLQSLKQYTEKVFQELEIELTNNSSLE